MASVQVEALESGPLGEWERSRRFSIAWCRISRHSATSGIFLYIHRTRRSHFTHRGSRLFSFSSLSLLSSHPLIRPNHPVLCEDNCYCASSREPKGGLPLIHRTLVSREAQVACPWFLVAWLFLFRTWMFIGFLLSCDSKLLGCELPHSK